MTNQILTPGFCFAIGIGVGIILVQIYISIKLSLENMIDERIKIAEKKEGVK